MVFTDVIKRVTELANNRREARVNAEASKQDNACPFPDADGDNIFSLSPSETSLVDYLAALDDESVYLLTMVMYIGCEVIGVRNLRSKIEQIIDRFPNPDLARIQVASKGPLDTYLRDGFNRLLAAGVAVDAMPRDLIREPAAVAC